MWAPHKGDGKRYKGGGYGYEAEDSFPSTHSFGKGGFPPVPPPPARDEDDFIHIEVKEDDKAELARAEKEQDAPEDKRMKLGLPVIFLTENLTPNVVASSVGNMLLTIKEGGLQYLTAGARCNVGVKCGRYAFQVRIVESLLPVEAGPSWQQGANSKAMLRVGFSTRGSSLILGEGEDSICFDETGAFLHNKRRTTRTSAVAAGKNASIFADSSILLVLNLDEMSPNFNTISLFKDGERVTSPIELPNNLKGKVLYPSLTFKHVTVHTNFAAEPPLALPFRCRMVGDAALEDVAVTEPLQSKSDRPEVVFPVFLPDEGGFSWADWYMRENPKYCELSDRALHQWAQRSGLRSHGSPVMNINHSNDQPDVTFSLADGKKIESFNDGSIKESLLSLAAMQRRSYVVMQVKNNLCKDDRVSNLKKISSSHKKIAQVMFGTPEEGLRKRTHEMMLAEKQEKLNREFKVRMDEKARQKEAAKALKLQEKARRKAEREYRKAQAAAEKARIRAEAEFRKAQAEAMKAQEEARIKAEEEARKAEEEARKAGEEELAKRKAAEAGVEGETKEEKKEEATEETKVEATVETKEEKKEEATEVKKEEATEVTKKEATAETKEEAMAETKMEPTEETKKEPTEETKEEAMEVTNEDEAMEEEVESEVEDEKMDEVEEKPEVATLTPEELQTNFRKMDYKDLSQAALSSSFMKFSLPSESEGFDEVRFTWSSEDASADLLQRWVLERKLTIRLEDLQPSEWFREKHQEWQKDLASFHQKHVEFKDPTKRPSVVATASKAAGGPPQAVKSKAGGPALKPDDKKEEQKEPEQEEKKEVDEDKDPMQLLEEEMAKEDFDVFSVDDVCDLLDGNGTPLFSNFMFEDWALLSLRFEIHLLVHAFLHDTHDPDRKGVLLDHLAFYYNKYYKKGLNPRTYGVDTVEELILFVKDTAVLGTRTKVIESMVSEELDSNSIFVKLTEESRRDRMRRVDAGETGAVLKFSRPAANPPPQMATGFMGAGAPAMNGIGPAGGLPSPMGVKGGAMPSAPQNWAKSGAPPPAFLPPAFPPTPQWDNRIQQPQQQMGGWGGGYDKGNDKGSDKGKGFGKDSGKASCFGGFSKGSVTSMMAPGPVQKGQANAGMPSKGFDMWSSKGKGFEAKGGSSDASKGGKTYESKRGFEGNGQQGQGGYDGGKGKAPEGKGGFGKSFGGKDSGKSYGGKDSANSGNSGWQSSSW